MEMNAVLLMIMNIMDPMKSFIQDLTFANLLHKKAKSVNLTQLLCSWDDAILRHTSV